MSLRGLNNLALTTRFYVAPKRCTQTLSRCNYCARAGSSWWVNAEKLFRLIQRGFQSIVPIASALCFPRRYLSKNVFNRASATVPKFP